MGKRIFLATRRHLRSASMSMMIVAKLLLLGLLLSKSYSQHISLCTRVDEQCKQDASWCANVGRCHSDCQTIDTVAYSCPGKCRGCSSSEACKDARSWCKFVKGSPICAKYDIGIKICPK